MIFKNTIKDFRLSGIQRLRETGLILAVLISSFFALSLLTFSPEDPSWSQTSWVGGLVHNSGGYLGAWVADILFSTCGLLAYPMPLLITLGGWGMLYHKSSDDTLEIAALWGARTLGLLMLVSTSCGLAEINFDDFWYFSSGGVVGDVIASLAIPVLNPTGAILVFIFFWGAGLTLLTGISWLTISDISGGMTVGFIVYSVGKLKYYKSKVPVRTDMWNSYAADTSAIEGNVGKRKRRFSVDGLEDNLITNSDNPDLKSILTSSFPSVPQETVPPSHVRREIFPLQQRPDIPKPKELLPTLELLFSPEDTDDYVDRTALERVARELEIKLADYKVEAQVVDIHPGPVITRFDLSLSPGVKVSRISSISVDLARSLSAPAVRVVEVIPGKPYVGLELPNVTRRMVYLSSVIGSRNFESAIAPTTIVLGKNISGEAVVTDLANMPHLLVAGTTGSGKSVGINTMILSMLYKSTPEDVRFIMVDPKVLELSVYEGIPHLLLPVITDMKEASKTLRWCVVEMERRYKLMSSLGHRNISTLNESLKAAREAGRTIYDPLWEGEGNENHPPLLKKLPYIVVIVDEFADLMMVAGKQVEDLVTRLAQRARASGIHLILATQRPSVNVITGLIKASIPTRIAFSVSTKTDSRIILDQGGAESLLGMGDMLYLPSRASHTMRVHGAFASDEEVHAIVNHWKAISTPTETRSRDQEKKIS